MVGRLPGLWSWMVCRLPSLWSWMVWKLLGCVKLNGGQIVGIYEEEWWANLRDLWSWMVRNLLGCRWVSCFIAGSCTTSSDKACTCCEKSERSVALCTAARSGARRHRTPEGASWLWSLSTAGWVTPKVCVCACVWAFACVCMCVSIRASLSSSHVGAWLFLMFFYEKEPFWCGEFSEAVLVVILCVQWC